MVSARTVALEVLERVYFDDAYSHIALSHALDDGDLSPRDRGLTTELVYGTLARTRTIDSVVEQFVDRSLERVDPPVLLALRLAAYQLVFLDRIPAHAAVDESVTLAKRRCGRGAGGFTNGVLRSMLRQKSKWSVWESVDPDEDPARHLGLRHSLPDWIAERLIDQYGVAEASRVAEAFNGRPPLFLRTLSESREETEDDLKALDAVPGAYRASEMTPSIRRAIDEGQLTVQDLGSQLVGHYSSPQTASRVLDACAGLGGKTLHLAMLTPDKARVTAVDSRKSKLKTLRETAQKASLDQRIETVSTRLQKLEQSRRFDLVIVDAPCSGLGIIRRHPETRWRRNEDDVANRARLQSELLESAAAHVDAGGLLVYSVCSFTVEEGPRRIDEFLVRHDDFQREPPPTDGPIDWSLYTDEKGDLRLNPADHDTDAFFAARLRYTGS